MEEHVCWGWVSGCVESASLPLVCQFLPSAQGGINKVVCFCWSSLSHLFYTCALQPSYIASDCLWSPSVNKRHMDNPDHEWLFSFSIQHRWLTSFSLAFICICNVLSFFSPDCVWFCECVDTRRGVGLLQRPCFMHEGQGWGPLGGLMSTDTHNSEISRRHDYLAEMHKKTLKGTGPPF